MGVIKNSSASKKYSSSGSSSNYGPGYGPAFSSGSSSKSKSSSSSNYGPGYGPAFSSGSSSKSRSSSYSSSSSSGPSMKKSGSSRVVKTNAASKKYSSSQSAYGPGYDPKLQSNKSSSSKDSGLSSTQIRKLNEDISDLNDLKMTLAYSSSENVRNKLNTAFKLLQSAQEDIQTYWKEPKEKVNEYLQRIEDQKNLINNVIKKIDEEILPQIENEISQDKKMLQGG